MAGRTKQTAGRPDDAPHVSFAARHRNLLLGLLSIGLFFAAWQAVFLFVPFNKLFISKPDLISGGLSST